MPIDGANRPTERFGHLLTAKAESGSRHDLALMLGKLLDERRVGVHLCQVLDVHVVGDLERSTASKDAVSRPARSQLA